MKHSNTDERDLVIISSLQDAPRASWAELAPVLRMGEDTLAERWGRLHSQGLAWVSLVDQQRIVGRAQTFILLRTKVGHSREVLEQLLQNPLVMTIHRISGSFNMSLLLETDDSREAEWFITEMLERIGNIDQVQVLPALGLIVTGAEWRTAALNHAEREKLAQIRTRDISRQKKILAPGWARRDAIATALIEELKHDGRMTSAHLTRRLKEEHGLTTSTSTVIRKITKILSTPGTLIRCDISASDLGWNAVVMLWGRLPPEDAARLCSEKAAAATSAHRTVPEIRSLLLLAGSVNFHATFWLHTLETLPLIEARLIQWLPSLRIEERSVVFSTPKRMGFVLRDGRRVLDQGPAGHYA